MSENDKPRGERRRSSRRGRRGSGGGGDRAPRPQQPPQSSGGQNSNQRQNDRQRSNKSGQNQQRGGQRQADASRPQEAVQPQGRRGQKSSGRQNPAAAVSGSGRNPAPARDRFVPPKIVAPTLPKPICPRCGGPIEDLPSAVNDKDTGEPIHFDCAIARLSEAEQLGEGEKIVYLGGGRFGVVFFENPADLKRFKIRKTLQWEDKDKRADWRRQVADLYSGT